MDRFLNVNAFAILAALWVAFAVALIASRSSLDATWRGVGALPLPLKGVVWLLTLPVMVGLAVWEGAWRTRSWPVIVRLPRRWRLGGRDAERVLAEGDRVSVAVVDCEVEIGRSPEIVFDYVTDISREFEWNPRTKRVAKLSDGPIGAGTRWEGEWVAGDPMLIDYVAFERPTSWRSIGRSRGLLVVSEGRIEPAGDGARLTLRVELEPRGRLRLIAPLLGRIMRGRERKHVGAIKERLERGAPTNGGGQQ